MNFFIIFNLKPFSIMLFENVIGYDEIKSRLIMSVKTDRIAHAQLFQGAAGSGVYPMALAYATYIMCLEKGETDACGVCSNCYKMGQLSHVDCHNIFPVNSAKTTTEPIVSDRYIKQWREFISQNGGYFNINEWYSLLEIENKQGIIRREEANNLIQKMALKSFEGGYKITIIYLPETMRQEAANALLKLLEEPPAKTLFILVTEQPDRIIETIRSRTQPIIIAALTIKTIEQELQKLNIDNFKQIAYTSQGNWTKALNIARQTSDTDMMEMFISLMRLCYTSNYIGISKWVETVVPQGREFHKAFCSYSLDVLRDCYMLSLGIKELSFSREDMSEFTSKFAPYVNANSLEPFIKEYRLLLRDITQNGNAKIVFTHFALCMCKIFALTKLKMVK